MAMRFKAGNIIIAQTKDLLNAYAANLKIVFVWFSFSNSPVNFCAWGLSLSIAEVFCFFWRKARGEVSEKIIGHLICWK